MEVIHGKDGWIILAKDGEYITTSIIDAVKEVLPKAESKFLIIKSQLELLQKQHDTTISFNLIGDTCSIMDSCLTANFDLEGFRFIFNLEDIYQ